MRFAPRTILGQLITGSVIVQMVVFAVFLLVSVRRELHESQQRDRSKLLSQTRTIVEVLAEPLSTGNGDMLDHIVRAMPISVSIHGVRITDAAGKTLRISNPTMPFTLTDRERSLLPEIAREPGYHFVTDETGMPEGVQAVLVHGRVLGIVWVTPDNGVVRHYVNQGFRDFFLYGTFALLGNLLLVWSITSTLARPLRQLRRATLQVQRDPSDLSSFPLPATVGNEAGELQASFNAMVEEIALQRRGTQETLDLLDSLLECAPIGFAFYDREYRGIRLNQNMARMHNIALPDHLGKRYRELSGASAELAETLECLLEQVFVTGVPVEDQEISGTVPGGGGIRVWDTSYFPVGAAGENVRWVGVIATDITERRRAEEALRRSERLAAAGRLAASIAHEINNPVESVTNLLYLLQTDAALNDTAREYVTMAQQELGRVGEITQQTLRFYRRSVMPTDIRLTDVLRSVLVLHQARTQSPYVDVRLRASDRAVVFGYPGELRQVFATLIGNALDAMPLGGVLYVRVHEARRMGKRGLRVTVADTGTGMSEEVRGRIFEPFFTTKEATGTGIGLWVSAEILEKHCASVQVRSRVSANADGLSGTVFSVFFPADGVPRGPVRVVSAAQALADHVV